MTRIITGISILGGWLLLLYINSFNLFWSVVSLAAALGLNEYYSMVFKHEPAWFRPVFLTCGVLPLLAAFNGRPGLLAAALVAGFSLLCPIIIFTRAGEEAFELLVRSCFGIFYCGFLAAHIIMIMGLQNGAAWLLFLSTVTAASDSGAYFTGKKFGRHKLCPQVSPKKTIEGFVGGLVCGTGAAIMIAVWFLPRTGIFPDAAAAFVLCCFGVMGDLTESVIKRAMKIKDSGTILPGHGGILDRADSLLLTAPIFYYILYSGLL